MKIIRMFSRRHYAGFMAVVTAALCSAWLTSVWPVMLSDIYDKVSVNGGLIYSDIASAVLLFGAVYITAELMGTARRIRVDNIATTFEKEARDRSVAKLLRLPVRFYIDNISGEYTAKINQAVSGASQLVKVVLNNMVPSVFISLFTVSRIIRKAPAFIALILITYIAAEIAISALQIKSQRGIRELLVGKKAKLDGVVCQSIQNIEMIRVTNAENYEMRRIAPFIEDIRGLERHHHTTMGAFDSAKKAVKVCYTVLLLLVSAALVDKGMLSGGMVITIILLFQQLVAPIDAVHAFMDELSSGIIKARELIRLLEAGEDEIFSDNLEDTAFPEGDIHVNNLTVFTPDFKNRICKDVNFVVEQGKVTALKGPTGCGKSSVIKAIMRFYQARGSVSAQGVSLRDISQKSLCDGIHNMVQYPVFFSGTLRDNLLYGLEYTPSDHQLIEALEKALIMDELKTKNEDVLSLVIAENGTNFSGGQRQRIAMARAFLRQPKWFFIDEATASIDDDITRKVFNNLKQYASSIGAGILCISHQKQVIEDCDKVIDLAS